MSRLSSEGMVNINKANIKALVGHQVEYLTKLDIDHSGRGYFFPRKGFVFEVFNDNISMVDFGSFDLNIKDLVEIRDLGSIPTKDLNPLA